MQFQWSELVGWYGVIAILLAYALSTLSVISNMSLAYLLLNLSGATSLALISFYKKSFQTVVLNIVWAMIALVAIVSSL